jgi:hypothetical protein
MIGPEVGGIISSKEDFSIPVLSIDGTSADLSESKASSG